MVPKKKIACWLLSAVLFPVLTWAADVRLAWNPNTEADLAGYKIHYGTGSGSYTQSVDVGKVTTATISNLSEGTTYYFASSAYNTAALASAYSNEVSYSVPIANRNPSAPSVPSGPSSGVIQTAYAFATSATDPDGQALQYRYDWGDGAVSGWGSATQTHSWTAAGSFCVKAQAQDSQGAFSTWSGCRALTVTAPAAKDSDGDGLSDVLETGTYGTNPNAADSDGDGISDGLEVAFWGASWNADIDGDGLANLRDWDADGDGFSDGEERSKGTSPGDKTAKPAALPMEAGEIAVDHTWKRVNFTRPFFKPVVVIGGLSANSTHAAVVRLRNVTASGFDIRVQEWECYDGVHSLETVGYLAVESGSHSLPGNVRVEAGQVNAAKGGLFSAFTFKQAFPAAPVLLAAVTTTNDPNAVTVRLDRITTSGFRLSLQEQEANLQDHGTEAVGYIAWQPSSGDFNGIGFEIDRTERAVTHAFMDIAFSEPHPSAPVFLGQMQSAYGKDTADLQWRAKDSHGVEVRIAEETSKDSETNHTTEVVGYMVFSKTP